ncbi:MAG: cob(I)yrinic acid a,c-diamide adenosyltransferase [Myxococcota bacterium]|jgi:cob(I)alamin adenosyltransferase|nr:cob(I)yrinic acid a,c-diamide adenosyltransferase [Myxococcota bacterium]
MTTLPAEPWATGCLQVYTGDGKGKTTAAFGLALRAASRGMKVFIGQFMKNSAYGEVHGARTWLQGVEVEQFGSSECIPLRHPPERADVERASAGLRRCAEILSRGEHPLVVLDEVNVAVRFGLVEVAALLELVDKRPALVELLCTGRYAPQALLERADLVTEMRCVRHPFEQRGLAARDGIER